MSVTTIHQPVASAKAVTVQHDFLNATPDGAKLFSVRAGIPLTAAFEQLTLFIANAQSVAEEVCVSVSAGESPQGHHATVFLLEMADALVQAMHSGLIEHEKAAAGHRWGH
jgi:Protein of unknown function (DUF3077)